jgi:hypothetical protein
MDYIMNIFMKIINFTNLKKCYFNFYESFLEYKPVIYLNAHKEHLEGLTCHKMFWKKHLKWWSFKKKDESNTTNQLQQFSLHNF